jgi:histidinol-phosphate phosphatase family protein
MAKARRLESEAATDREHTFEALVLAGGRGTRLQSVVADRPKPLATVGDEPFLARVLDQLAAAGCARAILCTGHLGEQIERAFGAEHGGMPLAYSREAAPAGTAGALRLALPLVSGAHVLVVNGDSYCDVDLRAFVRTARTAATAASLVATEVADTTRFGRVQTDADGRIVAFTEKGVAGPGAINAGIYWLPVAAIAALPATTPCALERDLLPGLLASGLGAFATRAPFLDIGVPADYAAAAAFFAAVDASHRRPRQGLLVVDRDGTLIEERHYLADPAGVQLLPGVVDGLRAFAQHGYEVAVITNQSGVGRGYFDEPTLAAVHAEMERQLAGHGITVRGIWHCPHTPEAGCACRKPEPALLATALRELGYSPAQCLVVGDKRCDVELGQRLGVRTALVRTGYGAGTERDGQCAPDVVVDSLAQLADLEVAR